MKSLAVAHIRNIEIISCNPLGYLQHVSSSIIHFYTNDSPYLNTVKSYLGLNLDIPRHHIQDEFVECFFRVVENEQVDWTIREEVEGLDQGLGLIRLSLLLLSLTTFNPYI